MNNRKETKEKTKVLVGMAIFTALVVVLQVVATALGRLGLTPPSLVLVPIVIGAAAYGNKAGAWLGFVFGVVVLLAGIMGMDAFTAGLFGANPFATALICLGKGTLAGLAAGVVFRVLQHKNQVLATVAAAIVCPVVNTALYLLGASTFFREYLDGAEMGWMAFVGALFVAIMVNFILEIVINIILSPVIVRILKIRKLV